jgi:bzd-type benzoyl-CoA reductase N subunit
METAKKLSPLDELLNTSVRMDNPYVRKWKGEGKRVVGYLCTYAPEEIIYAAGMLPYRAGAAGCTATDKADVYLHRFNCTFARCLLQLGLEGDYDFLDGFCFMNGCEQLRRTYDIWAKKIETKFVDMLTIPHVISEKRFDWYLDDLKKFSNNLASHFGVMPLDKEKLKDAIKIYNETRRLMLELYDLRKADNPPISGTEAMQLAIAAFTTPKPVFNKLMRAALDEIKARPGISTYRARIMIAGSFMDDTFLLDLIEEAGGLVVADNLCYGFRHFDTLVKEDTADPLEAIGRRYYWHNPCPRMQGEFDRRLDETRAIAKGANVDGIIFQRIAFCDNHGAESPMESKYLEEDGMPTIILEKEYMPSDRGRLKTRIQAFIERLERRK